MSDILELLKWWICGFTEGLFKELHDTSSKAFKAPFLQFLRFQTVGDRDRSFKIFQSQSRMRSTSCCSSPWDAQGDLRPMCSFKGVDQGVVTSAHHDFREGPSKLDEWLSGWWLTYPSEKCESQLGWWHSQYMESHKVHVPNHQPVMMIVS